MMEGHAADSESGNETDEESVYPCFKRAKLEAVRYNRSSCDWNTSVSSDEDVEDELGVPQRIAPYSEEDHSQLIFPDSEDGSGSVAWFKSNCSFKKKFDKAKFEQSFGARRKIDTENFCNIFFQYFNISLARHIIKQTELYATQKGHGEFTLTVPELNAFIGILIIMGFNTLPNQKLYWSSNKNFRNERISSIMSQSRFLQILQMLHLNDNAEIPKNEESTFDKLIKIRPILHHFQKSFRDAFDPCRYLSIGQSMRPFKGRPPLKHQGFNIWIICCAFTGYMLSCEFHDKKTIAEGGLGKTVVSGLCKGLEGKNYCLFFDRGLSSFSLIGHLLEQGFYCCTTILPRRISFPASLLKPDRSLRFGEFDYIMSHHMCLIKWKDCGSKAVCIVSTMDDPSETVLVSRTNSVGKKESVNCPTPVATYNKYVGGVDLFHQYMANYSIHWQSKRWWMKIFYYFIDAAIVNAYILYKLEMTENNKKPVHYLFFRSQLADELIGNFISRKNVKPKVVITKKKFGGKNQMIVDLSEEHLAIKVDSARRCANCSTSRKPRRSTLVCKTCNVALCKFPCFNDFHTNK